MTSWLQSGSIHDFELFELGMAVLVAHGNVAGCSIEELEVMVHSLIGDVSRPDLWQLFDNFVVCRSLQTVAKNSRLELGELHARFSIAVQSGDAQTAEEVQTQVFTILTRAVEIAVQ